MPNFVRVEIHCTQGPRLKIATPPAPSIYEARRAEPEPSIQSGMSRGFDHKLTWIALLPLFVEEIGHFEVTGGYFRPNQTSIAPFFSSSSRLASAS